MLDPALEVLLVRTTRDVPVDARGRGTRRAVLVRQTEHRARPRMGLKRWSGASQRRVRAGVTSRAGELRKGNGEEAR